MPDETSEPAPCGHVPLARDPERTQARLAEPLKLLRPGTDVPVHCNDNQVASCDRRNPFRVENTEWTFGNKPVSSVHRVPASGLQCFSKAEGALVT